MIASYEPKFPRLLRQWRGHDLAYHGARLGSYRPWFYERLRPEDELLVWRYVEENYLLKYKTFVGVRFEWSAEGLWGIPFPGSVGYGGYLSPADFGMPESAISKLRKWHDEIDRTDPTLDLAEDPNFDLEASRAKGLAAAEEIKLFLGDDHYVEFDAFREIAIVGGAPVELEVPPFITDLSC